MPASAINAKLPSPLLRAIQSDAAGNLWVASTKGVSRIAPDGTVRNFGCGSASAAACVDYRIDGFDRGWIDAGNSRTACYTNLQPGD